VPFPTAHPGIGARLASAPLLASIASCGCWRTDPAVYRGERAEDAGRRGARRSHAWSADFCHPEVVPGATASENARFLREVKSRDLTDI